MEKMDKGVEKKYDDMDEQTFIRALKNRHEGAFEVLVHRHQAKLLSIAWGITQDREESLEIVQDVFLNVHKHIGEFRGESGLFTWMRKITVNMCLNWKRKWKRRFLWHHQPIESEQGGLLAEVEENLDNPESEYLQKEFQRMLMVHVKALPEKVRAVFVLKIFEKMSYEEIAQTLGIKKGTVSSRLHYARKYLSGAFN